LLLLSLLLKLRLRLLPKLLRLRLKLLLRLLLKLLLKLLLRLLLELLLRLLLKVILLLLRELLLLLLLLELFARKSFLGGQRGLRRRRLLRQGRLQESRRRGLLHLSVLRAKFLSITPETGQVGKRRGSMSETGRVFGRWGLSTPRAGLERVKDRCFTRSGGSEREAAFPA
jgi:hypothetical protein